MFKNISWKDLLLSKTFWGATATLIPLLLASYGKYKVSKDAGSFIQELIAELGAYLAGIGLIDRTATPNAG